MKSEQSTGIGGNKEENSADVRPGFGGSFRLSIAGGYQSKDPSVPGMTEDGYGL
jgi:hypothetical protein